MADGDLTTLQSVKTYMGVTADTLNDKLSSMITAVSAWIKQWLNRDIIEASYVERLDGTGTKRIQLANYPVMALQSVKVDGVDVTANAICDGRRKVTLVDTTNMFRRDVGNVQITYTAGYPADQIPADLEHTACRIVAWGYTESTRIQQNSKSMGGEVVSFSTAMAPAWALENLKNWKKVI